MPPQQQLVVVVVPNQQRRALTETAACRAGRIYIQNPASMIPPLLLDPQPGEWILDLGAAPGSKTLQMAGMMVNRGKISAVESVRGRFFRLRANLEKHGATLVQTYLKDGIKVWRNCPEQFDRVLLDAACSAEGRFNVNRPSSYGYWSTKKIREMQRKQKRLLFSALGGSAICNPLAAAVSTRFHRATGHAETAKRPVFLGDATD